jgi:2-haloalkanoic acid dehalogenase type II
MAFDLKSYKGLFFDIYATLVDWEEGIYPYLFALTRKLPAGDSRREATPDETRRMLLKSYYDNERVVEHDNPKLAYPKILEAVYDRVAAGLGVPAEDKDRLAFGQSIGEWPAFPDTLEAMKTLAQHYKLFVLSNVDEASWSRTMAGPLSGVHWDGVYTAERIGSYKPNPNNYNYLVDRTQRDFGLQKDELLLVAQSLDIDHVMTKRLNFRPSVWIRRPKASAMGNNNVQKLEAAGEIDLGAVYDTLGELAEAVEKAWS